MDPLAASLASECEKSRLKTYSYGAALIAGGTKDTVADYIGNNRSLSINFSSIKPCQGRLHDILLPPRAPTDPLTMPDVLYGYIYNLGYGVGLLGRG